MEEARQAMSKLEIFNRIFQITSFRLFKGWNDGAPDRIVVWGLQGPVVPGTGWTNDYCPIFGLPIKQYIIWKSKDVLLTP